MSGREEDSDELVKESYFIAYRIKGSSCGRGILENAISQCPQQAPGS